MATCSSIFAWRITWTEEPGGLQSMGKESDTTEHAHTRHYGEKTQLAIGLSTWVPWHGAGYTWRGF